MRCPRCNSHVMPGLTECFSCGFELGREAPPPETFPTMGRRGGTGMLEQRRAVKNRSQVLPRNISDLGVYNFTGAVRGLVKRLPPIWVCWSAMFFGLWFFAKRRYRIAAAVCGLEIFLLSLLVSSAAFHFRAGFAPAILLMVFAAAAFESAREHLAGKGHAGAGLYAMTSVTMAAAFMIAWLAIAYAQMILNNQMVEFRDNVYTADGVINSGSHGIFIEEDSPRRGDIILFDSSLFLVTGIAGDRVEVSDCTLWVNDFEADRSQQPLDRAWENERCDMVLSEKRVGEGGVAVLMRYHDASGFHWRIHLFHTSEPYSRLLCVYRPLEQWRWFR